MFYRVIADHLETMLQAHENGHSMASGCHLTSRTASVGCSTAASWHGTSRASCRGDVVEVAGTTGAALEHDQIGEGDDVGGRGLQVDHDGAREGRVEIEGLVDADVELRARIPGSPEGGRPQLRENAGLRWAHVSHDLLARGHDRLAITCFDRIAPLDDKAIVTAWHREAFDTASARAAIPHAEPVADLATAIERVVGRRIDVRSWGPSADDKRPA